MMRQVQMSEPAAFSVYVAYSLCRMCSNRDSCLVLLQIGKSLLSFVYEKFMQLLQTEHYRQ